MNISELEQIGSELGLKVMKNPLNEGHISLYSIVAEDFFMTKSYNELRFYPYFRVINPNEKTYIHNKCNRRSGSEDGSFYESRKGDPFRNSGVGSRQGGDAG